MTTLRDIDERYQALLELGDNGILDDETFRDTLEGITGEREEKLTSCLAVLLELGTMEEALSAEMARLKMRKQRLTNNVERLKRYLLYYGGIEKGKPVKLPLGTLSRLTSERVIVTGHVPDEWQHPPKPEEPRPDKIRIKAALKDGADLDFAYLDESEHIKVT